MDDAENALIVGLEVADDDVLDVPDFAVNDDIVGNEDVSIEVFVVVDDAVNDGVDREIHEEVVEDAVKHHADVVVDVVETA